MIKHNLSLVVTACVIQGKAAMKMAAATCVSAKNELVRQGGNAPSQWVLGKFPRGVVHMLEEEVLAQLGVLQHQTDSATEFGLRAKWRLESMKAFVRQDCSARHARALLLQSGPIIMEFKEGDLIMYGKAEGPRWHGQGRIIGFDDKVLWTLHQGTPVAAATGRARSANVSEILAYIVLGNRVSERTVEQFRAAGQQQGSLDISGRRRMRSEVDPGDQDEEFEQPIVRARTAPAASSEIPQLEQRSLVT